MKVLLGIALAAAAGAAQAAGAPAQKGATYPSLAELPDWSGWWSLPIPATQDLEQNPPPMKPADLARLNTASLGDTDPDPLRFCRPAQFVGYNGGFTEGVEFLFTPGRVTVTNEQGLIRRIYTDGRALPANLEDTNAGTALGRWEGDVLVVETTRLNPDARYPTPQPGAVPIGRDVRISERIWLKDKDTLAIETVVVAPDVLTRPDRRTRLYHRIAKPVARDISFCSDRDRAIDPSTGKQRFDLTPPADLPPPPAR